jgi:hypothetical protein
MLLLRGSAVELTEPVYGYITGEHGVVVGFGAEGHPTVLVRFAGTGHAVEVAKAALKMTP